MRTIPSIISEATILVQARLESTSALGGYELPKGFMDTLAAKTVHIEEAAVACELGYPNLLSRRLAHNANVRHYADLIEAIAYTIIKAD